MKWNSSFLIIITKFQNLTLEKRFFDTQCGIIFTNSQNLSGTKRRNIKEMKAKIFFLIEHIFDCSKYTFCPNFRISFQNLILNQNYCLSKLPSIFIRNLFMANVLCGNRSIWLLYCLLFFVCFSYFPMDLSIFYFFTGIVYCCSLACCIIPRGSR